MRRIHPGPRAMMQLVRAVDCRRLRLEGVTLRDSEFGSTHLVRCEDVAFRGVKLVNEIPPRKWDAFRHAGSCSVWNNVDGINPYGSRRVSIERCFLHTGDDCVPINNTGCHRHRLADVAGITARDCVMRTSVTALNIGTEARGRRISRIRFENIHIVEASRVIGLDMKDGSGDAPRESWDIHVRRCNRVLDIWVIPHEEQDGQTCFSTIRGVTINACGWSEARSRRAAARAIYLVAGRASKCAMSRLAAW